MPAEIEEMDISGLIMKTLFYLVYDSYASRNRGNGYYWFNNENTVLFSL